MKRFKGLISKILYLLLIGIFLITGINQAVAGVIVTYYHTDALGSTVAATNESGFELWREIYRPYGERIQAQVDTGQHSVHYTGKEHDDDTGLTYFGARYYDPDIGRFMGMDPAQFTESNVHSFNKYAYGNNNPYVYIDPDGEASLWVTVAFVAIGVAFLVYKGKQATERMAENNRAQTQAGEDLAAASRGDVEATRKLTDGDLANVDKRSFNRAVDNFQDARDMITTVRGTKLQSSSSKLDRTLGKVLIGNELREEASEKSEKNSNSSNEVNNNSDGNKKNKE